MQGMVIINVITMVIEKLNYQDDNNNYHECRNRFYRELTFLFIFPFTFICGSLLGIILRSRLTIRGDLQIQRKKKLLKMPIKNNHSSITQMRRIITRCHCVFDSKTLVHGGGEGFVRGGGEDEKFLNPSPAMERQREFLFRRSARMKKRELWVSKNL